jgi:hypothetical protein
MVEAKVPHKKLTHGYQTVGFFLPLRCGLRRGKARTASRRHKQGVLTENLWPKLFSEAPRCAPLRLAFY